jgi:N-ethylmaleimide reductase
MSKETLFAPLQLGALDLTHRVVMAPLTRMRASQPGNVPTALNVEYYGQRASKGGLIISEATQVTPYGQGYPATPGIHSAEQVAGWRHVTDAVHAKGGLIFAQLWHVGRISHPSHQPNGALPVAPSPVRAKGNALTAKWSQEPFMTPRALATEEIAGVIADFEKGARNARAAGFDGVEIHSANGYLLDQFLQDGTNRRTDRYGGSIENRARLLLEVTDAVSRIWGANRVGVRLSPYGTYNDMGDSDPQALFGYVIQKLGERRLAYLHLVEPRGADETNVSAPSTTALFRKLFAGPVIAAGGFDKHLAEAALADGLADAVAFGRPFIANPDLPRRFARNAPLNPYDRSTFYGGDVKGYTDYPPLAASESEAA